MKKLAFVFAVALAGMAQAKSGYLSSFNSAYGTANTVLDSCSLCHPGGRTGSLNPFANDYAAASYSFTRIEATDSDADGYSNKAEIDARTFPGDATSKPAPTVTSCVDNDRDGYYVITSTCVVPAGAASASLSDCNDNNAAIHPGAAEVCTNGVDDNCNGLVDTADSVCPAPTVDFDITSLAYAGTPALRKALTINVGVTRAGGTGTATLDVVATTTTARGRTKTVQIAAAAVISATGPYAFTWKPSASGTWTVTATVNDTTSGETTGDSATTTVVVP